jgi:signal transduction histidine kinase
LKEAATGRNAENREKPGRRPAGVPDRYEDMRILVVDDNARERLITKKILEHYGCRVVEAQDGKDALEKARNEPPDLIVSDAMMPQMDGFQFLREVRKDGKLMRVPFVFHTAAYTGARETELADSLGADRFLIKPTDAVTLWNTLSSLAADHKRGQRSIRSFKPLEKEQEYLEQYSRVVASKLEEKVQELEQEILQRKQVEERLRLLSRTLLEKQEMDRQHIARELHDEIGQVLTAVKITVQSLHTSSVDHYAGRLAESIVNIDMAIEQIRNLALALRPSILDDLGLPAALRWLADRTSKTAGISVQFETGLPEGHLPTAIETACFRISQEALNNVARHAKASVARISLRTEGTELVLAIRDNGRSFNVRSAFQKAAAGTSFGMLSMKERAALAGGSFDIASKAGVGTVVQARFSFPGGASWS